jgi:HK97 gp10 family phage protein
MPSVLKWYGKEFLKIHDKQIKVIHQAIGRLLVRSAKRMCPVGTVTRGIAKGGKYWTARKPGLLKSTIKFKTFKWGVRLKAGNKEAWYARFVEYGPKTGKRIWKKQPFLRPAVDSNRQNILLACKEYKLYGLGETGKGQQLLNIGE